MAVGEEKLRQMFMPTSKVNVVPKRGRPRKPFDEVLADCIASAVQKGIPEGVVLANLCIATADLADILTGRVHKRYPPNHACWSTNQGRKLTK